MSARIVSVIIPCLNAAGTIERWVESLLYLEGFDWSLRVMGSSRRICFNPRAGAYITGRDSLIAIMHKFYTWGLKVPLRMINETWVTVKRWRPVRPANRMGAEVTV